MRKIMFRTWDEETKEMDYTSFDQYSDLCFINGDLYEKKVFGSAGETFIEPQESDLVLMQYTGMLDRRGICIYEGDILMLKNGKKAEVKWDKECFGGFCVEFIEGIKEMPDEGYAEIVGNIYENPEMIKRKFSEREIYNIGYKAGVSFQKKIDEQIAFNVYARKREGENKIKEETCKKIIDEIQNQPE